MLFSDSGSTLASPAGPISIELRSGSGMLIGGGVMSTILVSVMASSVKMVSTNLRRFSS